jgi:primosomal protein N' (replication factor Y) (superfamily II helicase)
MTIREARAVALADVALPVPVARHFSYSIPVELADKVRAGVRVLCPFGSRRMVGVVVGKREAPPPPKLRALLEVVDDDPVLPADLLSFANDLAQYYFAPIGDVVRLALPPIDRETQQATLEPTLFEIGARGVSPRVGQWAIFAQKDESSKLRGQAAEILAHLEGVGAETLPNLTKQWKSSRPAVKRLAEAGFVRVETRPFPDPPPFAEPEPRDEMPLANEGQREAIARIEAALASGTAATFLLHGVTGSGKTEVYLRTIAKARAESRGTIILVPEIALTPQLVARYRARFGDDVAVLHSGLTKAERFRMWWRIREGKVRVAMGARSALFAPIAALGLVIVDEEHDSSFKQEEGVRYHARDMAILRAHRTSAVCVLGSATPSLESEWLVRSGKATKLSLPDRARAAALLPRVELVDLRRIGPGKTGDKRLSVLLHRAIEETLLAKEQTILFLNRRGFAPSVRCTACGDLTACPDCAVALTFHKRAGAMLICHYCGYRHVLPDACPKCEARALSLEGLGTERLEDTLRSAFPEARIARLDRDVASGKAVEAVLARMRSRDIDILVGTQMVTKGHDLPNVTLVGVINADAALSLPDFRAAERAFQLLVQVAGRAGRGDKPGRVLIQTYNPEHAAIVYAQAHDVLGFIEHELTDRRELGYPPFARIALVRADAIVEKDTRGACETMARIAHEAAARSGSRVDVVGPAPAPLSRLRNRFRYQLMIRSKDRRALRAVLAQLDLARAALPRSVHCSIDIDPMQLL